MHACAVLIFDALDTIPSRCNTEIAIKKLVVVVTAMTTSLSGVPQFDEELTMLSSSAMAKKKASSSRALLPPPIHHPSGVMVEIVGIARGNCRRSCKDHDVCGAVLQEDCVVRIQHVQIIGATGKEESTLSAYWISNRIDCCYVGFLPHYLLKQWQAYNGRIAQVVDIYEGSDSVGFPPHHLLKQWQAYDGRIAQVVDIYKGSDSPAKKGKNVQSLVAVRQSLLTLIAPGRGNQTVTLRGTQRTAVTHNYILLTS